MTDLKQAGVGAFGDLGTHALDLMLWMLGDVERVTATLQVALGKYRPDCDETGEALFRFSRGDDRFAGRSLGRRRRTGNRRDQRHRGPRLHPRP